MWTGSKLTRCSGGKLKAACDFAPLGLAFLGGFWVAATLSTFCACKEKFMQVVIFMYGMRGAGEIQE